MRFHKLSSIHRRRYMTSPTDAAKASLFREMKRCMSRSQLEPINISRYHEEIDAPTFKFDVPESEEADDDLLPDRIIDRSIDNWNLREYVEAADDVEPTKRRLATLATKLADLNTKYRSRDACMLLIEESQQVVIPEAFWLYVIFHSTAHQSGVDLLLHIHSLGFFTATFAQSLARRMLYKSASATSSFLNTFFNLVLSDHLSNHLLLSLCARITARDAQWEGLGEKMWKYVSLSNHSQLGQIDPEVLLNFLHCWRQQKNLPNISQIYLDLPNSTMRDTKVFNMLLTTVAHIDRNMDRAYTVYLSMKQLQVPIDVATYNSLMALITKYDHLETAVNIFDSLLNSQTMQPDTVSFNIILSQYRRMHQWDQVQALYESMKTHQIPPDNWTFHLIISSALEADDLETAHHFVHVEAPTYNIQFNSALWHRLFSYLVRQDDTTLEDLYSVVSRLKTTGYRPRPKLLADYIGRASRQGHFEIALQFASENVSYLDLKAWRLLLQSAVRCGDSALLWKALGLLQYCSLKITYSFAIFVKQKILGPICNDLSPEQNQMVETAFGQTPTNTELLNMIHLIQKLSQDSK